jgi:tetratricopeptide (TPR) repeat protein
VIKKIATIRPAAAKIMSSSTPSSSSSSNNDISNISIEEFKERQLDLERNLQSARHSRTYKYDGNTPIKKLKLYLTDATTLYGQYKDYDNNNDNENNENEISPSYIMVAQQRRNFILTQGNIDINNLVDDSYLNPPSIIKVRAYGGMKIAQMLLAEAYEEQQQYSNAIPLYEALVDLCKISRNDIWESNSELHSMMMNLGLCYKRNKQYKLALKWYTNADRMCSEEDPGSQVHQIIQHNINVMMEDKAGPAVTANDNTEVEVENETDDTTTEITSPASAVAAAEATATATHVKKEWKNCWACNATSGGGSIGVELKRCSTCYALGCGTPAYYCNVKCQKKDWKRHKQYHITLKETNANNKQHFNDGDLDEAKKAFASSKISAEAEATKSNDDNDNDNDNSNENKNKSSASLSSLLMKYNELLIQAGEYQNQGDNNNARKVYEKMIKLDPTNPVPHHNIAIIYSDSGFFSGSIREYVNCLELVKNIMKKEQQLQAQRQQDDTFDPGRPTIISDTIDFNSLIEIGSQSAATIHAIYREHGEAVTDVQKPKFLLNDDLFLTVSKQVTDATPNYNESWAMLAYAYEKKLMKNNYTKQEEEDYSEEEEEEYKKSLLELAVKYYNKAAEQSEQQGNKTKFIKEAERVQNMYK